MADAFKWVVTDLDYAAGVWRVKVEGREDWFEIGYAKAERQTVIELLKKRGHTLKLDRPL